jgi:hypothetical protein
MVDYPAGWTCELTTLHLEHYLLGTLILRELLAIAEHLEACDGSSGNPAAELGPSRYRVPVPDRGKYLRPVPPWCGPDLEVAHRLRPNRSMGYCSPESP